MPEDGIVAAMKSVQLLQSLYIAQLNNACNDSGDDDGWHTHSTDSKLITELAAWLLGTSPDMVIHTHTLFLASPLKANLFSGLPAGIL